MTALQLPAVDTGPERRPSRTDQEQLRIGVIAPPWVAVPPASYGGIELAIDSLARGLQGLGHQVKLFTVGSSTCEVERDWLYDEPPELIGGEMVALRHAAAAYDALGDCDIIHDHTVAGVFLAAAARDHLGVPVVTTNHGPPEDPNLADVYVRAHPTVPVIAISRDQAQRCSHLEVRLGGVIHHGLDLERYRFRRYADDEGYLVSLGRMSPDKGIDLAIEIARRAGRDLVIAAKRREPAERRYFDEVIRPLLGAGIEFIGEVDHAAKVELLGGAAALVNPIRWAEPFGLVMIEALACGTPVLATPNGAAPEIVDPGITGYLAGCGSDEATIVDELAAATYQLDRIDRIDCRRAVVHRFAMEPMAAAHAKLYRRLIGRHQLATHGPTVTRRLPAAEGETMNELLRQALQEIAADYVEDRRDEAAANMAQWLRENHPGFAACPLRFGERAANAFLDTGTVEPADPGAYIAHWNHYQSQLIHRGVGH